MPLIIQTCISKVMCLLFNTLSRFVIAFLPRSKYLLISWLQSPSSVILEPRKIKSVTVSVFPPSVCHEMVELDATILDFWMLSFMPAFSLSYFTFIKRLFTFSLLSAIMVVLLIYLRSLIFSPAILIPNGDVYAVESKVQWCKEQYCIGTWNVRSMNQGKLVVVKQEMARVNIKILGISKVKWIRMGELNSEGRYIYYTEQEPLRRNGIVLVVIKGVHNVVPGCKLKITEWAQFFSKANHSAL